MSDRGARKGKKAKEIDSKVLSWREKKIQADLEEEAIGKEVEELLTWTNLIEAMDEQQLKEYLANRPESFQSVTPEKMSRAPKKRVQRSSKSNASSNWLMAAVWKFHKEDDGEASLTRQPPCDI